MYVCMYVQFDVCIFIKSHITAQSDSVILLILCHSHGSSQGGINDTCYDVCMYVCSYVWSSHMAKVRINRIRFSILLVVS